MYRTLRYGFYIDWQEARARRACRDSAQNGPVAVPPRVARRARPQRVLHFVARRTAARLHETYHETHELRAAGGVAEERVAAQQRVAHVAAGRAQPDGGGLEEEIARVGGAGAAAQLMPRADEPVHR